MLAFGAYQSAYDRCNAGFFKLRLVKAKIGRPHKLDGKGLGASANVFPEKIGGIPVSFRVRTASFGVFFKVRVQADAEMGLGEPDFVAQGLHGMPPEPPIQHIARHLGHFRFYGHIDAAVRHVAEAGFYIQITRTQQGVDILQRQCQSMRMRPFFDCPKGFRGNPGWLAPEIFSVGLLLLGSAHFLLCCRHWLAS